jgi:hypothetical protein
MRASLLAIGMMLVIAIGTFAAGYDSAPRTARPNPIRLEHGIPIGVLDTPAGAVAAADNYVVSEDDALLSPVWTRGVVRAVWAPGAQAAELAQPFPAAALMAKPATFPGLRLTAAVAASKLGSYTTQAAQIDVWHEVTVWGPNLVPTQRWALDTINLAWASSRWLITSRSSTPDAQTPVPAWTSGRAEDRTSHPRTPALSAIRPRTRC